MHMPEPLQGPSGWRGPVYRVSYFDNRHFLYLADLIIFFSGNIQFGDSQKLRLVRILRSTVMVRVGGGWMALDEFLVKTRRISLDGFG